MEVPARGASEQRDEHRLREAGDLANRGDPASAKLPCRDRAHAPEPLDRKRVEECELVGGRHDEQAVRLRDATRHLGEELGPGDPDRDGQADPLADPAAQPHGDLLRRARDAPHSPHVEKRLVDRQALDPRRGVVEDLEHRPARLGVGRHPRADHGRLRAQPAGLGAAHRGAHAARLGLVAGREHHPAPDDHRAAAQARVVALLDRRVEGIEVGVKDGRVTGHERMFASHRDGAAVALHASE